MKLPRRLKTSERTYLPKPQARGIKLDRVNPTDLRLLDPRFFCDDCSHYSHQEKFCTMGYRAQHTREEQMAFYDLTGKMALCRAIEID